MDTEKELFIAECMRLETFIRTHSSTYSDRAVAAVLLTMLKEIIKRQLNPDKAINQLISALREG